jgi:hypothetical protein
LRQADQQPAYSSLREFTVGSHCYCAVIVAVIAVPVVQLPFVYKVGVVTVRNDFIPMPSVISRAGRVCAVCRILGAHRQLMFIVVVAVRRVKVSIMKIIRMPLVTNRGVSAIISVGM